MTIAQATGAMSASNMYVGVSTDNAAWTDISGHANSVEVGGGERETGQVYTFTGDTPIIKAAKRGALTITVKGVYTESASQMYTAVKTAYEAGSAFYVRWSPGGGDAGDLGFTTSIGVIKTAPYPAGEADSGEAILTEFEVECASVTGAVIGSAGW
jgi:hypothetical protein